MTRRGTVLPSGLIQRVSTLKRELLRWSSFMKFVTSAYLEVAVKLLVSATVKGFCSVEERAERGEIEKIRSRIREKWMKNIFLSYLI
jgi:hypothetical protein